MGLHQLIRRISDLLHQHAGSFAIRHLLDRLGPNLPPILYRRTFRQNIRRGLLSAIGGTGLYPADDWHLHHLRRDAVLADLPGPRHLHGTGQWLLILPQLGRRLDLL